MLMQMFPSHFIVTSHSDLASVHGHAKGATAFQGQGTRFRKFPTTHEKCRVVQVMRSALVSQLLEVYNTIVAPKRCGSTETTYSISKTKRQRITVIVTSILIPSPSRRQAIRMSIIDNEKCKLALAGTEASSRLQEDKHQLNVCCFALIDTRGYHSHGSYMGKKNTIFLHLKNF